MAAKIHLSVEMKWCLPKNWYPENKKKYYFCVRILRLKTHLSGRSFLPTVEGTDTRSHLPGRYRSHPEHMGSTRTHPHLRKKIKECAALYRRLHNKTQSDKTFLCSPPLQCTSIYKAMKIIYRSRIRQKMQENVKDVSIRCEMSESSTVIYHLHRLDPPNLADTRTWILQEPYGMCHRWRRGQRYRRARLMEGRGME